MKVSEIEMYAVRTPQQIADDFLVSLGSFGRACDALDQILAAFADAKDAMWQPAATHSIEEAA